ncbi:PP2C family protein-serine/threonine phosphatase [Algivirga pacifica]
MALSIESKLKIKELELSALFETIEAINTNASESDLYRIFKFTVASNPLVGKFALFVSDDEGRWKQMVSHQIVVGDKEWYFPLELTNIDTVGSFHYEKDPRFTSLDLLIPIKHKDVPLAYVVLERLDNNEEDKKLSVAFIEALANIIIVAVENKRFARKEARQREYKRQLEIAGNVQALLFPKSLPNEEDLFVEASYFPHHSIGGDYYDFIPIDEDRLLFCIADVSGKGLPAAILMSNFQGGVRTLVKKESNLKDMVKELNRLIMENAQGENFITAFLMIYHRSSHKITYVNAGHNPPILFMDGKPSHLLTGTTILGTFKELPLLEVGELQGVKEFFLFCYTDGITETANDQDEEFGDKRLLEFLQENWQLDQKALHRKLMKQLDAFKEHQEYVDDITLLSSRVLNRSVDDV